MNPLFAALAARRVFVLFKLVPVEGKPKFDKVPIDPFTLANSNAQDAATWLLPSVALGLLPTVLPHLAHGGGIGLVIAEGSGLFCIDLDNVLQDGAPLYAHVGQICDQFKGAYIETSVSGRGLHIIGSYSGQAPAHSTRNAALNAELYTRARFIALAPEGSGDVLSDHTERLWAFAWANFRPSALQDGASETQWTTEYDPACTFTGTDDERIATLRRTKSLAAKFSPEKITFDDLWTCNVAKLERAWPADPNSKSGLSYDASSADQSAFNHLAYAFGDNCEALLRIAAREDFALRREKWENRPDYLRNTILKACAIPKQWKPLRKRNEFPAPEPVAPPPPALEAPPPPSAPVAPPPPGALPEAPPPPSAIPPPPATMPGEDVTKLRYIAASQMGPLFEGYTYVNDIDRIVGPDGFLMDKKKFDAHPRFAKRVYTMTAANDASTESAWEAFIQSEVSTGRKVRGALFDPRREPGCVIVREGQEFINTWRPVPIEMSPGDVTPFLRHLEILFVDHRLLRNYLKYMAQHKGEKIRWWPFIYGMPGNGKSFINETMRYVIGRKFTQSPTASNLDSQFNASLYGCLFLAIEDIKVPEDYEKMWATLKPMVTQEDLEVQPKGVDKVTREVCFNAILNSNHANGIRKEPDDRRIASFFSRQRRVGDLERDGLTEEYFTNLWGWAKGGGWAHVAYYLTHDPIDADFSPTKCPVTSSTAEHIRISRSPAEQEILEAVRERRVGFRGGWINLTSVNHLLDSHRSRSSIATRQAMLEALGYIPHPGLPEGQVVTPLADNTWPILYVLPTHATIGLTDPAQIKATYEAANR